MKLGVDLETGNERITERLWCDYRWKGEQEWQEIGKVKCFAREDNWWSWSWLLLWFYSSTLGESEFVSLLNKKWTFSFFSFFLFTIFLLITEPKVELQIVYSKCFFASLFYLFPLNLETISISKEPPINGKTNHGKVFNSQKLESVESNWGR